VCECVYVCVSVCVCMWCVCVCVCVGSLRYPGRNVHAPYCHVEISAPRARTMYIVGP